jgi:hypothetical protein
MDRTIVVTRRQSSDHRFSNTPDPLLGETASDTPGMNVILMTVSSHVQVRNEQDVEIILFCHPPAFVCR